MIHERNQVSPKLFNVDAPLIVHNFPARLLFIIGGEWGGGGAGGACLIHECKDSAGH